MDQEEAKEAVLQQLAGITQEMLLLEQKRLRAVRKANDLGASWQEVGDRLLITRSGAWRKYHKQIEGVDGTYAFPLPPEAPTA